MVAKRHESMLDDGEDDNDRLHEGVQGKKRCENVWNVQ